MAAFKQHCSFGFWQEKDLFGDTSDESAMGQLGHITTLANLPSGRCIGSLIKQTMKLNDADTKPVRRDAEATR